MGYLDYFNQNRGSSGAPGSTSSTRTIPYRKQPSVAPALSGGGRGFPERIQLENPFHEASQGVTDVFQAAGKYPGQVTETPFALIEQAGQRITGDKEFSPLAAIGQVPGIGAAIGGLGEGIERVGNFVPAMMNAGDMTMLKEYGDKPDDFELPWHSAQRADGVPVLGAIPGLQLLFSRAKTVGELKAELEKRNFLSDPDTGETRSWDQVIRELRGGTKSIFDFGYAAINDNPLVDLAGRIALDPTNLLFAIPGANIVKGGQVAAKLGQAAGVASDAQTILRAGRTIVPAMERAGLRAAKLPPPAVAKEAVVAGDVANITMRGMSSFYSDILRYPTSAALRGARAVGSRALNPRGYIGLGDGALTAGSQLGRAGQAIQRGARGYAVSSTALSAGLAATGATSGVIDSALGGNTFFQGIHDFVLDVENSNPLSENAAWMLTSAFAFPYGDAIRSTRSTVATEALGAFGSDFEVALSAKFGFGKNRAGLQAFRESVGGPERVNEMISYLVKHNTARAIKNRPLVGAHASSAPNAAIRARWADETLASVGLTRLRGNKISGDDLAGAIEDWHNEQMGFKKHGAAKGEQQLVGDDRIAPFVPELALRRWKRYADVQRTVGRGMQQMADGVMGLGLRDHLFKEQFGEISTRLKAAVDDSGTVSQAAIREVLEDYPALAISDHLGYWKNAALPDAKPLTWNSVRAKLGKQGKTVSSIDDLLTEAKMREDAAGLEDAPSGFEPIESKIVRLSEELEQHRMATPPDEPGVYYHGTTEANARSIQSGGFRADRFGERETAPGSTAYVDIPGIYVTKDFRKAADYYATLADRPTNSVTGGGPVVKVRVDESKFVPGGDRGEVWRGFRARANGNITVNPRFADDNGNPLAGYKQAVADETVRLAVEAGYTGLQARVGTETIIFDPSVTQVEGVMRPDTPRGTDVQAELEQHALREQEVSAAKRFRTDEAQAGKAGAKSAAALDKQAALPELPLNETTWWFDAELRGKALEWERAILEIDPTYTVKALPKDQILVQMRDSDPAIFQAMKSRTLLGELIFDRGPVSPFTGFIKKALAPVKGDVLAMQARQHLYQTMIPHGAKPQQVNNWIGLMQKSSDAMSFSARGQRFGLFRDISSLTADSINMTAREAFGPKSNIVKQFDGKFQNLLDTASSRQWRSIRSAVREGGRKGEFGRALEKYHERYLDTPVAGVGRMVSKTMYHWFRFLLDPRWIALNLYERNFLSGVEDGILKGAKAESRATAHYSNGTARIDEAALANMTGDTGWYYGRGIMAQVGRSFDKRILDSTETALNAMADTNVAGLSHMRTRMRREAEFDLADARRRREAGEDVDLTELERRANLDLENSNRDLSDLLNQKLYDFDQKGVKRTIIDEAKEHLDAEELQVMQPLLDVLYEQNEALWRDVNRLYHGNPERNSIERIANSYWMYWPISYQIKATKWLAGAMLDGSFGHNNGALLAGRYAGWKEEHEERIANNPAYAAMFAENPDLWFVSQMVLPITPGDIGITMSRPLRLLGGMVTDAGVRRQIEGAYNAGDIDETRRDQLINMDPAQRQKAWRPIQAREDFRAGRITQEELDAILAGDLGSFASYGQNQDPLQAAGYITDLGPIYTWHLLQDLSADVRGVRDISIEIPQATESEVAFQPTPMLPAVPPPSTP